MYPLTRQDAQVSNVVVECTIFLAGHTARVLFDLGATHSFTSKTFAHKLNKNPKPLKFQLLISTPVGIEATINLIYKGCEVMIEKIKTLVDLVKLENGI